MRALMAVVPGVGVAWVFKEKILDVLLQPLVEAYAMLHLGKPAIHFSAPTDMFVVYLKNSLIVGILLASPWMFWQLWGFIAPGLYRRERRLAVPFVLASTLCFVGGGWFGYVVVFPLAFETFLSFSGPLPSQLISAVPMLMIKEYMSFATRMLLAFGTVFEIPVVVSFLAAAHIVNWRQLMTFSRWWIAIASVIAAILTPPDVVSQLMMLVPLVVLYFIAVGVAYVLGERPTKAEYAARRAARHGTED